MSTLYVKINAAKEVEYYLDGELLIDADRMTGMQFTEVIIDEWTTMKPSLSGD